MSGKTIIKKVVRYEVDGKVYKTEEEAEFAKNVSVAQDIVSRTVLDIYDEDKVLTVLGSLITMNLTTKKKIKDLIAALESVDGATKTSME
jgi:hypothetical protein